MVKFQVTFDCHDVKKVLTFWEIATGFKMPPPPDGFASWDEFAAKNNIPEEEWAGELLDPAGVMPPLFFIRVPEGKVGKNRLHLDIRVSGGFAMPIEERRKVVAAEVERLTAAGATRLYENEELGSYWVTMTDPEGNEFCVN